MITHIVVFSWKPGVSDEQIQKVVDELSALPALVPSIRSYRVGRDAGAAEGNADFAVVATFDDLDGWRAYTDHPAHQAVVAAHIRPNIASRAAVQFES